MQFIFVNEMKNLFDITVEEFPGTKQSESGRVEI